VNNRQAQEVLLLYRPGTDDPAEPELAEALKLAEQDAALGRWFEQQSQFEHVLRAKFRLIEPPEGLKEQILSERKGHTAPGFRRQMAVLSAVVVVICVVIGLQFWNAGPRAENRFSIYRNRLAGIVLRQYPKMDLETSDLNRIHEYLAQRGLGDYSLPKPLEQTAGTGCKVLSWNEKTFSMVCFNSGKNGKPNEPDLFLFIIDRAAVQAAPVAASPEFDRPNRRFTTASWSSGDKIYVLGGLGGEEFLRKYL
jgi:hypothetical protein